MSKLIIDNRNNHPREGNMNKETILNVIAEILINDGPDGHSDGADVLADFTLALLSGPAAAHAWVEAYTDMLTLRAQEDSWAVSTPKPCPICGEDRDKDMSSAKAALSEIGLKAEHVDPGGRYLKLSDGSSLRLHENCNACDASKIFAHLGRAKSDATSTVK